MKRFLLQNRQFFLYCLIGLSGVALDFTIYNVLISVRTMDYQVANVIGYGSGTLWSFAMNSRFNFRVGDRIPLRLVLFLGAAFVGWLTSAGLLHVLIGNHGWDKRLAKLATLAVVVAVQYNLNRWLAFRKVS